MSNKEPFFWDDIFSLFHYIDGYVLIPHLCTMNAVKVGFYMMGGAVLCFLLANTN